MCVCVCECEYGILSMMMLSSVDYVDNVENVVLYWH